MFLNVSFFKVFALRHYQFQFVRWILGSHSSWLQRFLRYNVVFSVEIQPTFRWNISPPPSVSKSRPNKLASYFQLVPFLAYSLNMKVKAGRSSETQVDFHRTTLRYIPDDSNVRNFYSFEVPDPRENKNNTAVTELAIFKICISLLHRKFKSRAHLPSCIFQLSHYQTYVHLEDV